MPSLSLTMPHTLGQEEALRRLQGYLTKLRDRHQDKVSNLVEGWQDNTLNFAFTTYGFSIKGSLVVNADNVAVNTTLPFAAMMFKGKIEQTARDELTRILA